MTAPSYPIYEGAPGVAPRLAADDCEDFGGLFFTSATGANAPISHEDPAAEDFMQMERCIQRAAVVTPALSVDFNWDGASVCSILYVRALHRSITATSGLIMVTHDGAGDFSVIWDPGLLPPKYGEARAQFLKSASGPLLVATAEQTGNSVRVLAYDLSTSPSDTEATFTVDVFGE